jgi:hypothetical protein
MMRRSQGLVAASSFSKVPRSMTARSQWMSQEILTGQRRCAAQNRNLAPGDEPARCTESISTLPSKLLNNFVNRFFT